MVSATSLRAKLAGLLTDRLEVSASITQEFENVASFEDLADVMARGQGVTLTPEERPGLAKILRKYVRAIDDYLAGCTAKPVQSMMGAMDRERHERRRLGLLPRTNGTQR
jgi:hypothetical protein